MEVRRQQQVYGVEVGRTALTRSLPTSVLLQGLAYAGCGGENREEEGSKLQLHRVVDVVVTTTLPSFLPPKSSS